MMNGGVRAERYVGTIEEGKDLRKVFDMGSYDADTVQALATRLAMATFHSTGRPKKSGIGTRLPGNTIIELHIRVTASKGVNLKATISKIFATQRIKRKVVKHQIGKSDPTYRYFRKMNAHLGAAFLNCLETPKGGSKYHQLQNEAKNED